MPMPTRSRPAPAAAPSLSPFSVFCSVNQGCSERCIFATDSRSCYLHSEERIVNNYIVIKTYAGKKNIYRCVCVYKGKND